MRSRSPTRCRGEKQVLQNFFFMINVVNKLKSCLGRITEHEIRGGFLQGSPLLHSDP